MYFSFVQDLMDGAPGPQPAQVSANALIVQNACNCRFGLPVLGEHSVHRADHLHLGWWTRDQYHPVRLNAFLLTPVKHAFQVAGLVAQHPTQPEPRRAALAVAQFN
jgi:hypothetical protein